MKKISVQLYGAVLLATLLIFAGAWLISTYLNSRKTTALKNQENVIATQILNLENQSDVLTATVKTGSLSQATTTAATITAALADLQSKLSFMQGQLGPDNPDLFRLERYYSLLEIKDYALEQALAEKNSLFILYFYPNGACGQCLTESYILEAIEQEYPQAHVYTFNYTDDISAVSSLIALPPIPASTTPPFFIINKSLYPAFSSLSDMQAAIAK